MTYQAPDYGNSGLNLISSIAGHLGVPPVHPTLPRADELLQGKRYQNIVVMLFDGMGVDLLRHALPEGGFLMDHLDRPLSAVYPSTTTNATSCIECGLSPREHGWIGWTLFFPQLGQPVDIFPNQTDGRPAADYHVADRFIPRPLIFPRITAAGQAEACCVSPFGNPKVDRLDEWLSTILSLCRDEKRRYVYAYWPEPDHTMHELGCYDPAVLRFVQRMDREIEALCRKLPDDTLVLLTADHGLIDGEFHYLEDHPALDRMLLHDPTVESRAVSFHVRPECRAAFPAAFREVFGDHFLLIPGDAFIRDFLGDGPVCPAVYDFVGDYMALATDAWCIAARRGDHCMRGVHAGLTPQEMTVPLIVAKQ